MKGASAASSRIQREYGCISQTEYVRVAGSRRVVLNVDERVARVGRVARQEQRDDDQDAAGHRDPLPPRQPAVHGGASLWSRGGTPDGAVDHCLPARAPAPPAARARRARDRRARGDPRPRRARAGRAALRASPTWSPRPTGARRSPGARARWAATATASSSMRCARSSTPCSPAPATVRIERYGRLSATPPAARGARPPGSRPTRSRCC